MKQFNYITVTYSKKDETLFWEMKNTRMPNFCLKALSEFKEFSCWVKKYFKDSEERPLKYIVSKSEHPEIYNMGGDLFFFLENIKNNNKKNLKKYAYLCIDAIYTIYTSFGLSVITIALVEGNAYGGGFECALAHDYVLAQENVQFCLPENKFNLFPGMGAYSLLYRKLNNIDANTIIKSGKIYKARYLEALGLVENTFEKDRGEFCVENFIKSLKTQFNFEYHHIVCKKMVFPLEKEELIKITDIWVEACMSITNFDLRKMEILSSAQLHKIKVGV